MRQELPAVPHGFKSGNGMRDAPGDAKGEAMWVPGSRSSRGSCLHQECAHHGTGRCFWALSCCGEELLRERLCCGNQELPHSLYPFLSRNSPGKTAFPRATTPRHGCKSPWPVARVVAWGQGVAQAVGVCLGQAEPGNVRQGGPGAGHTRIMLFYRPFSSTVSARDGDITLSRGCFCSQPNLHDLMVQPRDDAQSQAFPSVPILRTRFSSLAATPCCIQAPKGDAGSITRSGFWGRALTPKQRWQRGFAPGESQGSFSWLWGGG